ncbi:MAG: CocE/NonD family hydrolase [Dehalococcoidia bacterium]|nr:CocE/NonD family hydrolase [Dehalococcoidia bacterium]
MREEKIEFYSGSLTLEGVLSIPDGREPFPAVIVCHPHPLHGGSMDNNVVNSLCDALYEKSIISFKFNFRGVGRSQGEYGNGIGEQEDVSNAISFLATMSEVDSGRIGLAGYSAGAAFALPVGCNDARVKALAAISPPLSLFDFKFLETCVKPQILISGSEDNFTPIDHFIGFCQDLPTSREYNCIEGADHFWWGYESVLAQKITAFFAKILKQ